MRQIFRTLSLLCRDWFANPRILWLPQAKSAATRTFITYVRDRLPSVTVAEACRACKLPQRTMQRIAQEEFGHGLRALISEVRMMRAMELLVKGDSSVETVARTVGFSSLGSFRRGLLGAGGLVARRVQAAQSRRAAHLFAGRRERRVSAPRGGAPGLTNIPAGAGP